MPVPLKRSELLSVYSKEHHFALLFIWKLKKGLKKNVALIRLQNYTHWFYQRYITPHFENEEHFLFPLVEDKVSLNRLIQEHNTIRLLFNRNNVDETTMVELCTILDDHIRYEERIVFKHLETIIHFSKSVQQDLSNNTLKSEIEYCDTFGL